LISYRSLAYAVVLFVFLAITVLRKNHLNAQHDFVEIGNVLSL